MINPILSQVAKINKKVNLRSGYSYYFYDSRKKLLSKEESSLSNCKSAAKIEEKQPSNKINSPLEETAEESFFDLPEDLQDLQDLEASNEFKFCINSDAVSSSFFERL
jgi:hypothetical protein